LGTTTRLAFLAGIVICVVMPTMLAQTSHTPPSVAPGQGRGESPAREGTGVVRGLVTSAQSGAPLRRARVWVRSSALPSPRSASTDESGRYEIAGLQPGSYFVRTSPSPADASFNLAPSYYPGTQDAGSAEPVAGIPSGPRRSAGRRAAGPARVRGFRRARRPHSRYFAIARPGQQRRFVIENLPPGEYLLAAVDRVEEDTEEDPALLESLRVSAARVLLGEGEQRTVTLRLTMPRR